MARSVSDAQRLVIAQKPELFVLDVDATYDSAQEFVYDLRTSHPAARAIILTATHFTAQRDAVAGLGAMHFLEKPFPRADFITLVEALLLPAGKNGGEHFQGTLSDLHIADIIQLKCISGATSMLEFTGPGGEKARVYFDHGQVRHATSPGKEGREAFNQIVDWKGGVISEIPVPEGTPRTITVDWQVLLMDAVRNIDETRGAEPAQKAGATPATAAPKTLLVIDDSLMLLSFVKEILSENRYDVVTAPTAEEGLRASRQNTPDLILLDYILPDMKGDEVCRKLMANPATAKIPVVYMSGFGSDLQPDRGELPNVIGSLNKPFTSESLVTSVENYLKNGAPGVAQTKPTLSAENSAAPNSVLDSKPKKEEGKAMQPKEKNISKAPEPPTAPVLSSGRIVAQEKKPVTFNTPVTETGGQPSSPASPAPTKAKVGPAPSAPLPVAKAASAPSPSNSPASPTTAPASAPSVDATRAYFCGDSSFFSLHWALQTIAREKLTGTLRTFWSRASVELLAQDGKVIVVTTREPQLYCEEAPVTLVSVDAARIEAARKTQRETGCPIFISLAQESLILRDPGLQLVQHYGQKLFAQLWNAERVRFVFEEQALPDYARDLPVSEASVDQWALSTLRFVQYEELGKGAMVDPTCVPAYTRDGYDRVQQLRLTVAEAQFASQFNGSRSVAQISKNLRLDIKFARLTLFRFLALEIVECWPAQLTQKSDSRVGFRGIFGR